MNKTFSERLDILRGETIEEQAEWNINQYKHHQPVFDKKEEWQIISSSKEL